MNQLTASEYFNKNEDKKTHPMSEDVKKVENEFDSEFAGKKTFSLVLQPN